MTWDPKQYHRFQQQRSAPFDDLLRLIEIKPSLRVVDLGCGTGELTAKLADVLPESEVLGIDDSPEMLEGARKLSRPSLRFELLKIEDAAGEWDLIFSHAALHWIENHESLIPRLIAQMAPGGQLAIQMPANHNHESQRMIAEIAAREPFATALGGWTRESPVLPIDRYAILLRKGGCRNVTVIEKVYLHELEDARSMTEWLKGTTMIPYVQRLGSLAGEFIAQYNRLAAERFPETNPLLYPFRRILMTATKAID